MRVLWIDPVNTDPHYLNMMSYALFKLGNEVFVKSVKRKLFDPPLGISWSNHFGR